MQSCHTLLSRYVGWRWTTSEAGVIRIDTAEGERLQLAPQGRESYALWVLGLNAAMACAAGKAMGAAPVGDGPVGAVKTRLAVRRPSTGLSVMKGAFCLCQQCSLCLLTWRMHWCEEITTNYTKRGLDRVNQGWAL